VRAGEAPIALVVPAGFGAAPVAFGPRAAGAPRARVELLADRSDPIAPQLVAGLLQKVAFSGMPDLLIEGGIAALDRVAAFTPDQKDRMAEVVAGARAGSAADATASTDPGAVPRAGGDDAPIEISTRDLLGETKKNPMVAFYAAGSA